MPDEPAAEQRRGAAQAKQIIALEPILKLTEEIEKIPTQWDRDSARYRFSIFGERADQAGQVALQAIAQAGLREPGAQDVAVGGVGHAGTPLTGLGDHRRAAGPPRDR